MNTLEVINAIRNEPQPVCRFVIVIPSAEQGQNHHVIGPFQTVEGAREWINVNLDLMESKSNDRGWTDWGSLEIWEMTDPAALARGLRTSGDEAGPVSHPCGI